MIAKMLLLAQLTFTAYASTCGLSVGTSHVKLDLLDSSRVGANPSGPLRLVVTSHHKKLLDEEVFAQENSIEIELPNSQSCREMRVTLRSPNFRTSVSPGFDGGLNPVEMDMMLIPRRTKMDFANAQWDALSLSDPLAYSFFHANLNDDDARTRYDELMDNHPLSLAAFFNLSTSLIDYDLDGDNLFNYFKEPVEEKPFRQDRFFAYVSPKLLPVVLEEKRKGNFANEHLPWRWLHPGATVSFKQTTFRRADVQISFHQNWRKRIDGVDCIVAEVDIDYYPPGILHVKEVLLNKLLWRLTNPTKVFALRKSELQRRGEPGFLVPYELTGKK